MAKENKQIKINCTSDKYMTFAELSPFEDNPRELSDSGFKKLKKSILELGLFKPFLVWKKGNKVLGGNQRFRVMQHLVETEGYSAEKLPVTVIDVDEGTARVIVLRDNQSDGDWAYEMLAEYMEELEKFGIDKSLTGFTDREFDDLQKLAQSPDELRKSLETMAGEDNVEEMVTKKFGVSFKVPDEDWTYWQDILKIAKKETGKDDVWSNIKYVFSLQFPLTDEFADAPKDDLDPPKKVEEIKPAKKKTIRRSKETQPAAELPV